MGEKKRILGNYSINRIQYLSSGLILFGHVSHLLVLLLLELLKRAGELKLSWIVGNSVFELIIICYDNTESHDNEVIERNR